MCPMPIALPEGEEVELSDIFVENIEEDLKQLNLPEDEKPQTDEAVLDIAPPTPSSTPTPSNPPRAMTPIKKNIHDFISPNSYSSIYRKVQRADETIVYNTGLKLYQKICSNLQASNYYESLKHLSDLDEVLTAFSYFIQNDNPYRQAKVFFDQCFEYYTQCQESLLDRAFIERGALSDTGLTKYYYKPLNSDNAAPVKINMATPPRSIYEFVQLADAVRFNKTFLENDLETTPETNTYIAVNLLKDAKLAGVRGMQKSGILSLSSTDMAAVKIWFLSMPDSAADYYEAACNMLCENVDIIYGSKTSTRAYWVIDQANIATAVCQLLIKAHALGFEPAYYKLKEVYDDILNITQTTHAVNTPAPRFKF